jgi:hypothetical protein
MSMALPRAAGARVWILEFSAKNRMPGIYFQPCFFINFDIKA